MNAKATKPLTAIGITILIALCLTLAGIVVHFVWTNFIERLRHNDLWYFEKELAGRDAAQILVSCRELMRNPEQYRHHPCRPKWADASEICLAPAPPKPLTDLPKDILDLKPIWIQIASHRVMIRLNVPNRRVYLLAFADGAQEYGTKRVLDGLWYWNGLRSSKIGDSAVPPQ